MLSLARISSKIKTLKLPLTILALGIVLAAVAIPKAVTHADCATTPNSALGTDSMNLSVPSTGTYYVWTRMESASTSSSNNIYMQVDGGCATSIGGSTSAPANTWNWINYQNGNTSSPVSVSLSSGNHTILMTGEGSNVSLDKMLFLSTSSCTPTGDGSNCTTQSYDPPVVSITSPSPSGTVSGTINLSANATDDDASIASVVFSVDGNKVATDTASPYSSSWNSTSVTNGPHTLTATATNSQGQATSASESIDVSNSTTCTSNPSTPTNLSATASGTQTVNLTWSASTPASGCTISGYEVYRNGALVGSPATTSYSDSGLNANTTYTYYVVALDNQSHTSAASSTAQATTAASTTVPSNPTNVSAKAVTAGSVSLSWNASSDSSGIYGYMIYRNNAYYATVTSGTSFTDYKVTANSYYTYAVSAFDKSNNQSAVVSAAGYVHTPSATSTSAPSTPSGLKVVVTTDDSAAVEWNASTDRLGVAGYHIYRNGHQVATITSGTSYTSYCLQPSTNYSFAVVAFDSSANTSSQSSTVSTRTEAGSVACSNGDLNNDGKVNYLDLSIMLDHWGSKSPTVAQGDMNADGAVNMTDLQFLLSHWGQ